VLPENHSKVSQLARITDCITHGFNLRRHTGIVLLDIEKAYDLVWINSLLLKEYDVHVSVHLGNVFVRLTVQLDAHGFLYIYIYIFFIPLYFCSTCFGCYLHPSSGAQTAEYSHTCV
jgi:hypothetical protein